MTHPQHEALQRALDDWLPFAPCLGANVSLYDAKYGAWHGSTGWRTLHPRVELEPEQDAYIYSITKSFTATLAMLLVEDKRLALDTPANSYLDGIELAPQITVRQLLNHSSGISSYTDWGDYLPALRADPGEAWGFHQVLQRLQRKDLDFEPGSNWHYSNSGYMLLLLILETVSGQSYDALLQRLICSPLGLKSTRLATRPGDKKLMPGFGRHLNDAGQMQNIVPYYDPWWCKTGLLISNTAEVNHFYQQLLGEQILKPASLRAMLQATSIGQSAYPPFRKPCYGFGLMIDPEYGHGGLYGHGGDGPGFNTWAQFHPDFNGRQVGLTLICNTARNGHAFDLAQDLLRVLENAD